MYTDFYGLREMPFSLTPDSRFLFLSSAHREALGHLLYGIRERKGFILITGEIGTGKTTLCRALLNQLGPDIEVAFVMNTFVTERQLLMNIVYDLMEEHRGRTKKDMLDQLNEFLLRSKSAGKNVVILIDECQNLSAKVMEQIRMLSNLETERDKLLQIILVGQPEVRDILAMPRMRQLNQRIAVRYHLHPLSRKEMGEYIRHRLKVSGLRGGLRFARGALSEIYRYSGGTPRLINIICDRALLVGYVRGKRRIGRLMVRRARSELSGAARRRNSRPFFAMKVSPGRIVKAALVAAVIFIAFLGWANRDRLIVAERAMDAKVNGGARATGGEGKAPQGIAQPVPLAKGEESGKSPQPIPLAREEARGDSKKAEPLPPGVAAMEKLLNLWGYDGPVLRYDTMEGLVQRSGLRLVGSWAELPFLLSIDLPCILETGSDYYVLRGIDGDTALCWVGEEEVSIPLDDLNRRWDGRAFIVNRSVSSHEPLLLESMKGDDVGEIQTHLNKLNYYRGSITGNFDEATEEAVMRLQESFGLNADGIIGPETRLALWSTLAGDEVPRLRR